MKSLKKQGTTSLGAINDGRKSVVSPRLPSKTPTVDSIAEEGPVRSIRHQSTTSLGAIDGAGSFAITRKTSQAPSVDPISEESEVKSMQKQSTTSLGVIQGGASGYRQDRSSLTSFGRLSIKEEDEDQEEDENLEDLAQELNKT